MLLAQSVREGLIETYEREFAENALIFGDLRARQVMVPRGEIDYLVVGETISEAVQRTSGSLHTRLPLCDAEEGLDDPVGVINSKELLRLALGGVETDLSELARPLTRVSESTLIDQVLRELRKKRQHLALVVDEFGTTVGLITLEDILEEIVGEFEEEEDGEHDIEISAKAVRWWSPGPHLWETSRTSCASSSRTPARRPSAGMWSRCSGACPKLARSSP